MSNINWISLYTSFSGRIDRMTFWIGVAGLVVAGAILQGTVFSVVNASDAEIVALVSSLVFVYPALAVYAKRCHDRGKSAWWLLMLVVPLAGFVWLIVDLGVLEGDGNVNQFGTVPAAA